MPIKQWDVLITGTLVAIGFVQLVAEPPERLQLAAVLTLAMTLPVLARRSWPAAVTTGIAASVATYCFIVDPSPPFGAFLAMIVMAYTLAREGDRMTGITGFAAIAGALVVTSLVVPTSAFEWVYPVVYFGGAATAGLYVRQRSRTQHVETESEVRTAISDERTRIARELHDVVAHGLGVMVLHAEAADELLDSDPAAARTSLGRIQITGRESIRELKFLLELLRAESEPAGHAPQPTLDRLPVLIAEFENPQRTITLSTRGEFAAVPTGVQLTVFRVVQEALTNAAKHSSAAHIDVTVTEEHHRLVATVTDSGPRRPGAAGTGHGLLGMAERARLYGGQFDAGPHDAGYRVRLEVEL